MPNEGVLLIIKSMLQNLGGKVGFILGSKMLFHYEGMLPEFYGRYGFEREEEVILMGMKIE